jgi:hypothetical protein
MHALKPVRIRRAAVKCPTVVFPRSFTIWADPPQVEVRPPPLLPVLRWQVSLDLGRCVAADGSVCGPFDRRVVTADHATHHYALSDLTCYNELKFHTQQVGPHQHPTAVVVPGFKIQTCDALFTRLTPT